MYSFKSYYRYWNWIADERTVQCGSNKLIFKCMAIVTISRVHDAPGGR